MMQNYNNGIVAHWMLILFATIKIYSKAVKYDLTACIGTSHIYLYAKIPLHVSPFESSYQCSLTFQSNADAVA